MFRSILTTALFFVTALELMAQPTPTWTSIQTTSPGARYLHFMSYDRARDRVVLYGGAGLSDVWELDGSSGNTWLQAASGPGVRHEGAMAYDESRHVSVLFGGYGSTGFSDQTYEYDGQNWMRRFPDYSPPAGVEHEMWYDELQGKVFLYGGQGPGYGGVTGTWSWDGSRWRLVSTGGPHCVYTQIAYDRIRHVAVLFGGMKDGVGFLNETWEFDGFQWQQRFPATTIPPARYLGLAAFHEEIGKTVMYGGYYNGALGDTWEWDGNDWTPGNQGTALSPASRYHSAIAYDNVRGRAILFGGYTANAMGDTWSYQFPPEMEAGDLTVEIGSLLSGDLDSVRDPDEGCLAVRVDPDTCDLQVQFVSFLFMNGPTQCWFKVESHASSQVLQVVELYNFSTAQWDLRSSTGLGTTDSVAWAGVTYGGSVYRGPFSLTLARARYSPTEADMVCGPDIFIDHVGWYATY